MADRAASMCDSCFSACMGCRSRRRQSTCWLVLALLLLWKECRLHACLCAGPALQQSDRTFHEWHGVDISLRAEGHHRACWISEQLFKSTA